MCLFIRITDPYNVVSKEQFSPSIWPTFTYLAKVFDSLQSTHDKGDMIDALMKVGASEEAKKKKNLYHVLPPSIKANTKGRPKEQRNGKCC